MTRPPSPLTMLLSRHTRRREFITLLGGAAGVADRWFRTGGGQNQAYRLLARRSATRRVHRRLSPRFA